MKNLKKTITHKTQLGLTFALQALILFWATSVQCADTFYYNVTITSIDARGDVTFVEPESGETGCLLLEDLNAYERDAVIAEFAFPGTYITVIGFLMIDGKPYFTVFSVDRKNADSLATGDVLEH